MYPPISNACSRCAILMKLREIKQLDKQSAHTNFQTSNAYYLSFMTSYLPKTMENNRTFNNCITLDQKMLKTLNRGIELCLGCFFDLLRDTGQFSHGLDFIGIILFYYLKTMENNRKTTNTIEIVKKLLLM